MIEAWLNRRWYGTAGVPVLQPLAWLYGAAVSAHRLAFRHGWRRSRCAGAPVVVIGNLTVGGTGKTPLAIWLARQLTQRGILVGLVSRGYGRASAGVRVVGEQSSWREVGDEPLLLHRRTRCPTAVGRDRVAAAAALIERGAQVIVADDGLQHLPLARDCEIVVVDGRRGFGNGGLLPAGPLREPLGRLRTVDAVVVNGPIEHPSLRATAWAGEALRMALVLGEARRLVSGETRALESFKGRVHAVAAIGHPERFFRELSAHGLTPVAHPFPDHHPLSAAELDFGDDRPVLMTEKDAVKCSQPADPRLWYVPAQACFSDAEAQRLIGLVVRKIESPSYSGSERRGCPSA